MPRNQSTPAMALKPAPGERPLVPAMARGEVASTMLAWERFQSGEPVSINQVCHFVVSSWQRSLELGVNPQRDCAPLVASGDGVTALRARHRELLLAASGMLADAPELFAGSRSIMLLTDPAGVVLEAVGDGLTLDQARNIHLMRGGSWSEGVVGTNGIGTALATGRPAQVHAAEHFCEGIKRWTCAAAPIFEPGSGAMLGVIDISGPPSTYQRGNLVLAVTAARQIQSVLVERATRDRLQLLELCLGRLSSSDASGLVVIDRAGRLVHAGGSVTAPVGIGQRLPGLHDGVPIGDWSARLPEGWRAEWFDPVTHKGQTIGAMLTIPSRLRSVASRGVAAGSEADPQRSLFHHIVGRSPALAAVIDRCRHLAGRRVPVLVEGETGVGKELIARALHGEAGPNQPFVVFNCGAASKELLAGELFGHVRGAFTGATSDGRPGRFELAHRGTLCLDEIGEMPLELQPVLLRVVEEGVVYRLGDSQPRHVDVRLVAVTNRNLRDEVAAGRFRRDLYYRLGVTVVTVPPLRARVDDIEVLADHFNRVLATRHNLAPRQFSSAALDLLRAHDWPGNVRELRNVIEGLLLTSDSAVVQPEHLPAELRGQEAAEPGVQRDVAIAESLDAAEQVAIARAMQSARGNLSGAARMLGISRSTLYRKLVRRN
jgi:sigma-54 dependent transcriptional regulator, acetoin dehydrogenase operon transcriptional activator AcoR